MGKDYLELLSNFYYENCIHPQNFHCRHEDECRSHAYREMTEAKMSIVGTNYGLDYPKIVVLSLDPPLGNEGPFSLPEERTTIYVTKFTEKENYSNHHPNIHWAMTQIIVKDILVVWGYESLQINAAVVKESYADRPIDNVSRFFSHVNVAKCSMNNPQRRQANKKVHNNCGYSFLFKELSVLEPDILISQGKDANILLYDFFYKKTIRKLDLPTTKDSLLNGKRFLWIPMIHPSRNLTPTRNQWDFYLDRIQEYKKNSK